LEKKLNLIKLISSVDLIFKKIMFWDKIHIKSKDQELAKIYITMVICGLSIFFFRKLNNTIVRKNATILSRNEFKQFPKRIG